MSDAMREQIADVVRGNLPATREMDDWAGPVADEIIAALPGMVPPLKWYGLCSGPYEITIKSVSNDVEMVDLYYHGNRDEYGESELITGGYITLVSVADLKAEANAHHVAAIMQALGGDDRDRHKTEDFRKGATP